MVNKNNRNDDDVKPFPKESVSHRCRKMNHRHRIALKIDHRRGLTRCKPPFIFFIEDRVVFWMLFLLPDWRLVCAVPALQKLQPLLLQRVHPGACHRDQEPAKEIQIHGHPSLSSEPHTFASFTSECPNKCDQQWGGDRPEGFLAKSRWRCCCVKNKQQCFHVSSHWVN